MTPLELYADNAVLLAMAVLLPFIGAVLLPFFKRHGDLRDAISITVSLCLLVLVLQLVDLYRDGSRPRFQLWEFFPGFSITLALRPLGVIFAATASFLWVATTFYSIAYMRRMQEKGQTRFAVCFALAIGATMGIAFSDNLFSLFIFYELLTLLTYPLVAHKGDKAAARGARVYLSILMFASLALLLPAILITQQVAGTLAFVRGGILGGLLSPAETALLLAMFVFGTAKAALMPFHRWLPAAMVAPAPVSALLHAVAVVKAGVFTVLTVIVYVFGLDELSHLVKNGHGYIRWLEYAACFTILTASLTALRKDNLKQRLAYSTVAQLSYIVLGAALLAPLSLAGAVLHLVAHAFAKITLFFGAGAVYAASGKSYISEMDGIGRAMPWTMGAFTLAALALIGIPPTLAFLSKWYILLGALQGGHYLALAVLTASTLLSASYLLPIIHRAFFRPPAEPAQHGEAPRPMAIVMAITSAMTVVLFFASGTILSIVAETLSRWEPLHLP